MDQLRRVLYIDAALWMIVGVLLAVIPRFTLVTVGKLPPSPEYVWVRAAGILSVSVALLMVLVAQNAEQTWFWTWAFILAELNLALLFVLKALFSSLGGTALWWIAAAVSAVFGAALLWGIARAYAEAPKD